MSLFNYRDTTSLLNDVGNNRGSQRQQRQPQQNQHNTGKQANSRKKPAGKSLFTAKADEIIRRFDDDDSRQSVSGGSPNEQQQENVAQVEAVTNVLTAFSSAFKKNLDKPSECKELIETSLEDVCAALKYYYDPRFENALSAMNAVIDIMTTNYFAQTLLGILKQNSFDNWNEFWKDVAFAISIVLNSSANKMKDATVQIYVSDILASNGMWRTEIDQLVEEVGITEDLATDLVIGLPVRPEDMNDIMMRSIYKEFLWTILNHAEDNIEVLDRTAQRKLFDFCFDDGKKLACKVIGRFLSGEEVKKIKELEGAAALVYGEFKAMLYEKLETYDVHNIAFVLKFIVDQRKREEGKSVIFSAEDAAKYDTIRKAIMQIVSKDDTAKQYLV